MQSNIWLAVHFQLLKTRDEIGVALNHNNRDLPPWISLMVRGFEDIDFVPKLDM